MELLFKAILVRVCSLGCGAASIVAMATVQNRLRFRVSGLLLDYAMFPLMSWGHQSAEYLGHAGVRRQVPEVIPCWRLEYPTHV